MTWLISLDPDLTDDEYVELRAGFANKFRELRRSREVNASCEERSPQLSLTIINDADHYRQPSGISGVILDLGPKSVVPWKRYAHAHMFVSSRYHEKGPLEWISQQPGVLKVLERPETPEWPAAPDRSTTCDLLSPVIWINLRACDDEDATEVLLVRSVVV